MDSVNEITIACNETDGSLLTANEEQLNYWYSIQNINELLTPNCSKSLH